MQMKRRKNLYVSLLFNANSACNDTLILDASPCFVLVYAELAHGTVQVRVCLVCLVRGRTEPAKVLRSSAQFEFVRDDIQSSQSIRTCPLPDSRSHLCA